MHQLQDSHVICHLNFTCGYGFDNEIMHYRCCNYKVCDWKLIPYEDSPLKLCNFLWNASSYWHNLEFGTYLLEYNNDGGSLQKYMLTSMQSLQSSM